MLGLEINVLMLPKITSDMRTHGMRPVQNSDSQHKPKQQQNVFKVILEKQGQSRTVDTINISLSVRVRERLCNTWENERLLLTHAN